MKRNLLIPVFLLISFCSFSQVIIQKTEKDYTLKIDSDSIIRHLTFWKDNDSTYYSGCKYSCTKFKTLTNPLHLSDEIQTMEMLWKSATDSIEINLNSIFIGYPSEYIDILTNHILAFTLSDEWQNHIEKNGKTLDYKLMQQIMLDYNVYKPLNDFLLTKGYQIKGFSTEKHGFVTKEELIKLGYSGKEIIPLPFMVWISIKNKGCSK